MFTGIVKGIGQVTSVKRHTGLMQYTVRLPVQLSTELELGASLAIDGVCQTLVAFDPTTAQVSFDAISETLQRTTLDDLHPGDQVNVERSARFGDEIGGHLLSGHVYGRVRLDHIRAVDQTLIWTLACEPSWTKYLFSKGFVALHGCSLTVVQVNEKEGTFTVHLIPETVRRTTMGQKPVGAVINLELDAMTQALVETVERILNKDKTGS